jgi:hypothetical protein
MPEIEDLDDIHPGDLLFHYDELDVYALIIKELPDYARYHDPRDMPTGLFLVLRLNGKCETRRLYRDLQRGLRLG